ncbi:hypothetical protein DCAR_0623161 [Daucus carota subsp. sativus]|uniref:No apical meristem-associated C-terminal domain-containing protein n=1 Tax=Daucus carota subsp. sativus TaxID=79200 RepID=A0AAF0X8K5_DAUCS|nr:hypothetical protein DCAR_0623161 [Daucus carota subsp. sativus]
MNFQESVPSFSTMLIPDFPTYDEYTTGNPSIYFPQDHNGEESEEVRVIPSQNFTKQEDEMLISAWQNISSDPIIGVDQTNGTYWERIHNYFTKYKDFQSDRSWNSLMHRWSVIQLGVNKFQGFYEQVGIPSGCSEDDKICRAKIMYKDIYKTNFSLEHCWKVLRNLPKWNASFATKKPKKIQKDNPAGSSPCTPEYVVLDDSELKRPIGRKAAKEMEKKRKRSENEHDDGGAAILEQMRADQLESKKQRNEHLKEMIQLAKERAEREKERDEREKIRVTHEQDEADAVLQRYMMFCLGKKDYEKSC